MIGIYKITNKTNGKVYIGLSTQIEKRWISHRNSPFNPKDKDYESPLYRAIRKYGLENFTFDVLEECQICELSEKEIYYISLYDANNRDKGYNRDSGGLFARHGKLTEELVEVIKERIRTTADLFKDIADDYGLYEKTIRNINAGRTWRVDGEQYPIRVNPTKEKVVSICEHCGVEVTKGAKCCKECAQILQRRAERPSPIELAGIIKELGFEAAGRRFGVSGNTIKKWCKSYQIPHKYEELVNWYNKQMGITSGPIKPIRPLRENVQSIHQIDMGTGEVINTFESASAAERWLGRGHRDKILDVCKGKRKSAYGYYWKFA